MRKTFLIIISILLQIITSQIILNTYVAKGAWLAILLILFLGISVISEILVLLDMANKENATTKINTSLAVKIVGMGAVAYFLINILIAVFR